MSDRLKEVLEQGRARFIQLTPDIERHLQDRTSQEIADAIGTDLTELRQIEASKYIAAAAERQGKDTIVMLIELGSDSAEEADELKSQRWEKLQKAIGVK